MLCGIDCFGLRWMFGSAGFLDPLDLAIALHASSLQAVIHGTRLLTDDTLGFLGLRRRRDSLRK